MIGEHVIDGEKLQTVCKMGQGYACCRYITAGGGGIECAKLIPELKAQIDHRVAVGAFVARGDNCEGV